MEGFVNPMDGFEFFDPSIPSTSYREIGQCIVRSRGIWTSNSSHLPTFARFKICDEQPQRPTVAFQLFISRARVRAIQRPYSALLKVFVLPIAFRSREVTPRNKQARQQLTSCRQRASRSPHKPINRATLQQIWTSWQLIAMDTIQLVGIGQPLELSSLPCPRNQGPNQAESAI